MDPWLRELLGQALEHPAVDPGNLVRPITSIAMSRPRGEVLADPLLLRLLEDALVRDAALEQLLVTARREALGRIRETPSLPLAALAAIAHQCFNTEYLYPESAAETALLENPPDAPPLHWYAAFACYRPLHSLPDAAGVARALASTPLASLARRQILEPIEEQRLRGTMQSLGAAVPGVSQAVQALYEENPYPRWLRTQSSFEGGTPAQILRELFPHADLDGVPGEPPRILVAGCGTGQHAIATARRFQGSSVLAIDLSLASLAYAKRKTLELGVGNVDYRQADILALGSMPERFDLIESSGVLHHLADPFSGWQVLASLLKPRGLMRIGLYSEAGRANVIRARE